MIGVKELADNVAKAQGIPKSVAKEQVGAVLTALCDAFASEGFSMRGHFTVKQIVRKGRKGSINGHDYETKDKNTLRIEVGPKLDEKMNK